MASQNTITKTDRAISTAKQLNALKPHEKEYEVRDSGSPGLRLRVSPKGRLTWFYRYASPETGKTVKLTLGQYIKTKPGEPQRGMSLSEARIVWADLKSELLKRKDPKQELARKKKETAAARVKEDQAAERNNLSVATLVNAYIDAQSTKKKSWKEEQRILNKFLVARHGNVSVYNLTRGQVREVLAPLREEGKNVQANRLLAAIRGMFNWALAEDWPNEAHPIPFNPCAGLKAEKEKPRDRSLNNPELRKLLKNLPKLADPQTSDFLLFVLATGCRIGEAASMEHAHLFGDRWRLPTSKNGKEHTIFLSDFAQEILKRRPTSKGFVWPSDNTTSGYIRKSGISNNLIVIMDDLKIDKFTPHDLRRTLASWLGSNEVQERIHDRMLNHTTGGIRQVYNVASYDKPAREWWQKWGQHLQALSADNVVTIDSKEGRA